MAQDYIPAVVPTPGHVVNIILQIGTFGVLCICFSKCASHPHTYEGCTDGVQQDGHHGSSTGVSTALLSQDARSNIPRNTASGHLAHPPHLCRLHPLRPCNLHHRAWSRHQLLPQRLRRRHLALPEMLLDHQDPDLLLPGRARIYCPRKLAATPEDQAVAVQLPVHDTAIYSFRHHEFRLADRIYQ